MPLISTIGAASSRGFGEFSQQSQAKYIENYFNSYLYNGNGTALAINNGIELASTGAWNTVKFFETGSGFVYGVDMDASSNLYACGRDDDGPNPNYAWVAKFDSTGTVQWKNKLSTSAATYFNALKVAASGNVYGCGYSNPNGFLAKYDSSGALQWQRKLSGSTGTTTFNKVTVDPSENVFVVGSSTDATSTYPILLKYNSSGVLQWQRRLTELTTGYTSSFASVVCNSAGDIFVAGFLQDATSRYAAIAKYNTSGTLQWQRKLRNGTTASECSDIYVLSSGEILVSGLSGNANLFLVKVDSTGSTIQWQRNVSDGTSGGGGYISVSPAGDIYFAHRASNTGTATSTASVIKYNASGTLQWQRKINSSYSTPDASGRCVYADNTSVYLGGFAYDQNAAIFGFLSILPTDGSATSGFAFVNLFPGTATDASGSLTNAAGTGTAATSVATDASNTLTDSTATITVSNSTQSSVSSSGGLVWLKSRSNATDHALYDTARGATLDIASNTTAAQTTETTGLTAFSASGFAIGSLAKINTSAAIYAAWTFRKSPKFFDIVTYTGTGANRTISHSLGSVPGMIIIKRTDTTAAWAVYHRSLANTEYLVLNTTAAKATGATYWNSTTPTSTVFSLGTSTDVNANGGTYVAYLFAHDAGGFGLDSTQNVISCGSYTGNGSATGPVVTLGYEPQCVWIKNASGSGNWQLLDNMRGIITGGADATLQANSATTESAADYISLTPTGFQITSTSTEVNTSSSTYIYIAIRRGPMKTPTSGTSVFMPTVYTGTNVDNRLVNTTIAPDMVWGRQRDLNYASFIVGDRLRGQSYFVTSGASAETSAVNAFDAQLVSATEYGTAFSSMNGVWVGNNATAALNASLTASNQIMESFKRAPGFFDIVAYTGNGASRTISHNLGSVPQLILVKCRDSANNWAVYSATISNTQYLSLNTTNGATTATGAGYWNSTTPTSSQFSLGGGVDVNSNTRLYVAYLFGNCPGVSKVGTYTGTGTTQQIDCGFSSGARFVLIKRTDSTADWYLYDSARGISASNDPYFRPNLVNAEVTNTDYVNPYSAGFELSSTAPAALNEAPGITWNSRTTGISSLADFYKATYGGGLYVVVGSAGSLTTSPDLLTWTTRTSKFVTDPIYGITYGNGVYVAVGANGKVSTSPDGANWTLRTSGVASALFGVTFGNGLFVAVGAGGTIITSTDGITWTAQTSGLTTGINDVTYGNGLYVAVGSSAKVITSPDAITWTTQTTTFASTVRSVTYGNGLYVAVGDSSTQMRTSPDGVTWTARTSGFGTSNIYGVTYGNGLFVAVGDSGKMTTSTDGITWTARTSGFGTTIIWGAAYGNNAFIAVGAAATTTVNSPSYTYLAIA